MESAAAADAGLYDHFAGNHWDITATSDVSEQPVSGPLYMNA